MIGRDNRFHGHAVIARLRGETFHGTLLSFRFSKTKRPTFRLAVVVSKKVAPKAVDRNRIRRRIFEIVRTQGRLENLGVDVVIYAKTSEIATKPHPELSAEVLSLTKKMFSRLK